MVGKICCKYIVYSERKSISIDSINGKKVVWSDKLRFTLSIKSHIDHAKCLQEAGGGSIMIWVAAIGQVLVHQHDGLKIIKVS